MKVIKSIIIILLLIFLSSSCSNDTNSITVKNWQIIYEQDITIESVMQKSGWESIDIPSTFKMPYQPAREMQYAWLKGEFEIDGEQSDFYGLSIGRVCFTEEVFVNKQLIGSRDSGEISHMYLPRNYTIPGGILVNGKNHIFIRIGIYGYEYGGISSNVLIQPKMEFRQTEMWSSIIYRLLPFGMIFLFFGFMINLIINFFLNKNEILFLYATSVIFVYIILILFLFSPFKPASFDFVMSIQFASVPLIGMLLMLFIQSLYGVSLPEHNRIFIPVLSNVALIILFSRDVIYDINVNRIIGVIGIILGILYILYMFLRLNSIKPKQFNLYMIPFLLTVCGFVFICEIIFMLTGMHYSGLFFMYSSPLVILIIVLFITEEFKLMRKKKVYLYEKVKLSEEHEKNVHTGDNLSITEESERKLTRIIDFVKENYTSDISREGLAAAVGMNYNYMSRLFKIYTGKKLNEYIHELRIEDSVRKLKDKNARIIDIALSVGFESLVTFNRAFKKIMGKTPSEYRNQLK